jgi:hypothetical protein
MASFGSGIPLHHEKFLATDPRAPVAASEIPASGPVQPVGAAVQHPECFAVPLQMH